MFTTLERLKASDRRESDGDRQADQFSRKRPDATGIVGRKSNIDPQVLALNSAELCNVSLSASRRASDPRPSSKPAIRMPIRLAGPSCCAPAASGHAAPPRRVMKSRPLFDQHVQKGASRARHVNICKGSTATSSE
jgi:hypothetical protein